MKKSCQIASLLAGLFLAGITSGHAAIQNVPLYATMDPDGYYTESQFVGGGGSIGFSDGDDADSFYTFANAVFSTGVGGSYITGSRAGTPINVFPNDEDFYWGTVSYDDDTIDGVGTEYATITSAAIDVSSSIDFGTTGDGLALVFFDAECPIVISGVSGTVTLVNGEPTGVNLTATATFFFDFDVSGHPYLEPVYTGTFTISGTALQLYINDTYIVTGLGSSTVVWDLPGVLDL